AQGALAKEISALNDLIDNAKKIKTLQLKQKKLSLEREARELPQRIRKTAAQIETITQEQADRPSPEKLREEKAGKEAELGALRRDIASKEEAFAAEEKNLRDELSEKSSRSERLKEELQIERNELATAKTELESAIDCLRRAHGNIPSTMPEEWFSMSEETQGGFTLTTTRASPMLEQVSESPVAMEYLADQLAQLSGVGDVLECISKLYPTTLNSKLQNICRTVFEKICQSTVDAEIRQEANAADLKKEAVNKMADLLMAFKNVDFSSLETKFFPTDSISNESKIRRGIFMEAKRISQEINKLMNTSNPTA
ncbi:MAG: hypothetical protein LBF94_01995, partial [Puniceicoccales bacterium]|nr:hypothetical protein [Puniceicoccales bacterium]